MHPTRNQLNGADEVEATAVGEAGTDDPDAEEVVVMAIEAVIRTRLASRETRRT